MRSNRDTQKDQVMEQFAQLSASLHQLIDTDPAAAIARVENLVLPEVFHESTAENLRACIYVDAGTELGDSQTIQRGIEILERLVKERPEQFDRLFSLANGLSALADLVPYTGVQWYLVTAPTRERARALLQRAAEGEPSGDVQGRAYTNLGNALIKAYRFVEAYDCYVRALSKDPTNTVASTGAARILLTFAGQGLGDKDALLTVANHHLRYARENPERLRQLAGAKAFEALEPLLKQRFPDIPVVDLSKVPAYQRFVAEHRLALALTIDGLALSMRRWDSLQLPGIFTAIDDMGGVPPIFAMFNVLKSDFLAARYIAFTSLHGRSPRETGSYADSLDYARYGVDVSMLMLAQRAAIDLLDKVAVALTHYLGLGKDAKDVYFTNRFYKQGKEVEWDEAIAQEIAKTNRGLLAICEVARDVREGGYLKVKRALRHASTHRFAVLHDLGTRTETQDGFVEHYDFEEYGRQVIEAVQLARATLIYFVQTVADREGRMPKDGVFPIEVMNHHWIRGRR